MKSFLSDRHILYKEQLETGKLTGMGQGGVLPLVAYPRSKEEMIVLFHEVKARSMSFLILGGITNTYISSGFHCDIVIITTHMNHAEYKDDTLIVEAGYSLNKIAKELTSKLIAGYDGFIGIPGTIGGAAINNSGAFDSSMSNVVKRVLLINAEGNEFTLCKDELEYGSRHSILKGNDDFILLSVELDISRKLDFPITEKIEVQQKYRRTVIDGNRKSLGTVFVATSMEELFKRHRIAMSCKKYVNGFLQLLFHSKKLNTYLVFLFLGHPELAKHCDSLNRFEWDKETTETDFFYYIDTMQNLAGNKLQLEIEIKR